MVNVVFSDQSTYTYQPEKDNWVVTRSSGSEEIDEIIVNRLSRAIRYQKGHGAHPAPLLPAFMFIADHNPVRVYGIDKLRKWYQEQYVEGRVY
jgi:hypothetical protein